MVKIKEVDRGSIAEKAGIEAYDFILFINGHRISDEIDLAFYESDANLDIGIRRNGTSINSKIKKLPEEKLGIMLESLTFRRCGNSCIFCFYDQMPAGLRKSLYEKDDDYRLSFLYGNYITLTNMKELDFERIAEQRLSPLYVSVHSTDARIRAKMLGVEILRADISEPLTKLARAKIEVHSQIVVCPGINDGDELKRTINDLVQFYPSVRSIAIIPVGLTKFRENLFPVREISQEGCLDIIEQTLRWQEEYRKKFGISFVYPSDEIFIKGEFAIPMKEFYDGFPQLENGVGVSRIFLDEIEEIDTEVISKIEGDIVFITASLPFPWLNLLRKRLVLETSLNCNVVVVNNKFFGDKVSVSGLLTGCDILEAIRNYKRKADFFMIPSNCLNDEGVFLDELSVSDIERQSNKKVVVSPPSIALLPEFIKRGLNK